MKFGKLLSFIFALIFTGNIMAAVVQPDVATTVARNFLYERFVQKGMAITANEIILNLSEAREVNGNPAYYIFNAENGGWVIISGDDVYSPVIGYSSEGSFPVGTLDKNLSSFLQDYVDQIEFARNGNYVASNEVINSWNQYTTFSNPRLLIEGERDVEPLLSIMWNQDYPYNAFCPEDAAGPGGHVYAGCVATAMSMIMYYYRYPEVGTGSFSYYAANYGTQTANFGATNYNWDAMQNSINGVSGQAVSAIAELQYHCGVSVRMGYAPDGSGAYSADVPPAIKNYFGYSQTAGYIQKMGYTTTGWENILIENLNANKPLYYSGQSSSGGHAFVCDGWQQTGTGKLFHFNFGWSGSGNGYFSTSDVGGFNSQQGMVRNFFPDPANYPYSCDSHVVTSTLGSIEDGSGPLANYEANSNCTWLYSPEDSVSTITLNLSEINFSSGDSLKVYDGADENATLLATFAQGTTLAPVTSTGCNLFVQFITNGSEEGAGFRAEHTSTYPVYCTNSTTNLTAQTGEFGDGSGEHKYNNGSVCKWKINPGPAAIDLTLAFDSFELEDGKDFLKVFSIPDNQLLANLTGSEIPEPIVSPTGQFMVMFSSNGFNNFQGFEANYYIANVNTKEEDFTRNLAIYPNPAGSYTDIKFNLTEPSNVKISIHNLLGEVVYSEPTQLLNGYVSRTIQLGELSKGVYLIQISGEKGTVSKKLIVK